MPAQLYTKHYIQLFSHSYLVFPQNLANFTDKIWIIIILQKKQLHKMCSMTVKIWEHVFSMALGTSALYISYAYA